MDESSLKIYFKYVRNVLGIKQIFSKNIPLKSASLENVFVLISVENLKTYNSNENSLLEKMVSALTLDAKQISIMDAKEPAPPDCYRINLVDTINVDQTNDPRLFITWSPRHLLQNPEHKKEAWAVMQSLLKRISS